MPRTAILNVVGLTRRLIGEHTPNIRAFVEKNQLALVEPQIPAVTCTAQATYVTGRTPRDHGIVANGWYDRGWHGLLQSYTAGLPFLSNTLAGDLTYSAAFFGAYVLATRYMPWRASVLDRVAPQAV